MWPNRTGSPGGGPGVLSQEPQGQGKGNVYQTEVKNQPRILLAPGEAARWAEPGWVTPGQGKGNAKTEVAAEAKQDGGPQEQSHPGRGGGWGAVAQGLGHRDVELAKSTGTLSAQNHLSHP